MDDYYTAVDAIGEKILERDEIDAGAHRAPPPSSALGRTDGPIEHADVGPSGRLIPKGGDEDPGEILRGLKDAKLASNDVEHWSVGTKGDGKIYLNPATSTNVVFRTRLAAMADAFFHHDDQSVYTHRKNGTSWMQRLRRRRTRKPKGRKQKMPKYPGREPQWAKGRLRKYWIT